MHDMSKQAIIESVLDTWLTSKQLDNIQKDWQAFYNAPMQYSNSIVTDMIKQYLKEGL